MKIVVVGITGTPYEISNEKEPDFDILARQLGSRYSVLVSDEGNLFDPLKSSNNINEQNKERGGLFWKLRTCGRKCYQNYTTFLRSKHRTPYIFAQRRFSNDVR